MTYSPIGPGLIALLGCTQIVGYGTIYYAYPVLVPQVAAEFGTSEPVLYAVMAAGLFVSGLAAPWLGGLMDRFQAPRVMVAGSLVVSGMLAGMALAPSLIVFAALVIALKAISFAVLYDAAFATLALRRPQDTRAAITSLTLVAGFASTIFWPLTGWLVESLGWRGTVGLWAGLNLLLAFPLHLWLSAPPRVAPPAGAGRREPVPGAVWTPLPSAAAPGAFLLLGWGFALSGMLIAAMGVQMVPILLALDLGDAAYLVAMAMGPAQVAIRIVDATLWRRRHPLWVALVSALAVVAAVGLLPLAGGATGLAMVCVILFGAGHGLASIVRGAVPVALFGAIGLGRRLGRLAALRAMLAALAPFLFALGHQALGLTTALLICGAVGLAGFLALLRLWSMLPAASIESALHER